LRDYLTDLFPIIEVGTSAKMLSIVPLLGGGGLFETGAGGSAPKHVQQFVKEGYLRWDSLGEFSALMASLEHLGNAFKNEKALVLAETLDQAIAKFLDNNRSPPARWGRSTTGEAIFTSRCMGAGVGRADQGQGAAGAFRGVAKKLEENEAKINQELLAAQAKPMDIGGYYDPDPVKTSKAMRPARLQRDRGRHRVTARSNCFIDGRSAALGAAARPFPLRLAGVVKWTDDADRSEGMTLPSWRSFSPGGGRSDTAPGSSSAGSTRNMSTTSRR